MKNILIDNILYNPTIYIYNITRNFATVYNAIDNKVLKVRIKIDKSNDKYIIINNEYHWFKYMFDLNEKFN